MKATDQVDLIRSIAREVESRYDWIESKQLLALYEIDQRHLDDDQGLFNYLRDGLGTASHKSILKMADDLNVEVPGRLPFDGKRPAIWTGSMAFRLFVSHLAMDKDKAHRLKETLTPFHVSCFVAHDDIDPTKEWQNEIELGLFSMDAMLCVHTKGFKDSVWTQQEVGCAIGRGVRIFSLRMDEDPTGFIAKTQAILWRKRTADLIAAELNALLIGDIQTKERMAEVTSFFKSEDDIPF
jgi:TIR domain